MGGFQKGKRKKIEKGTFYDYRYKHITNSLPLYRGTLFVIDMANGVKSHHYGTTSIACTRTPSVLLPGENKAREISQSMMGSRC